MDATSDEIKEVYAHFGLAYYHADVLHRGLCHLYALSQVSLTSRTTHPRFEEHLKDAYISTLGRVVNLVTHLLPEQLLPSFRTTIDQRNFLAHHFWYERVHLLTTSAGCTQLLAELSEYSANFQSFASEVEIILGPLYARMGATQGMLQEALAEVLQGRDQPLPSKRRPRKEEVVVAIYDVPTSSDGSTLIFQTADSELWQLCDAGLGWTVFDGVGADWVPCTRFNGVLPAHINPRPQGSASWSYEIFFGKGVSLVVRPGSVEGAFQWSLRRKGA